MEPVGLQHGANLLWEEFTRDSPLGLSVVSVEVAQAPESLGVIRQTPTCLGLARPGWMLLISPAGPDPWWLEEDEGLGAVPRGTGY